MDSALVSQRITPNLRIEEVLTRWPQCIAVFERYGLACFSCHAGKFENVGQGARVHGLDIDTLLGELNDVADRVLDLGRAA